MRRPFLGIPVASGSDASSSTGAGLSRTDDVGSRLIPRRALVVGFTSIVMAGCSVIGTTPNPSQSGLPPSPFASPTSFMPATPAPADETASPGVSLPAPAPSSSTRSVCQGSVASVSNNLTGAPADQVEQLQGTYENDSGFMAVVFDGSKPVVIVDQSQLSSWQTRLKPKQIAVAPSCVDPRLVDAVQAVLPSLACSINSAGGNYAISAGYNGLDDGIDVRGIDSDTLISAIAKSDPAMADASRAAIAAGTLRIDPSHITSER